MEGAFQTHLASTALWPVLTGAEVGAYHVLSFKCCITVPLSLISRSITVPDYVDFFGNTMPLSVFSRGITVPHYVDYFGIAVSPDFFCGGLAARWHVHAAPSAFHASVPCFTIKPL
jgi:hypothetical protein